MKNKKMSLVIFASALIAVNGIAAYAADSTGKLAKELKALDKTTQVRMGGADGGGGDTHSLEFAKIGHDLISWVESQKNNSEFPVRIDSIAFKKVVLSTRVESTNEQLVLDGIPKDAINYPAESRILFNRNRWSSLKTYREKAALVFHEYLGIMRVDDSTYRTSSYLLGLSGTAVDELDIDLITNANRCSIIGLSLADCEPDAARDYQNRLVAQEIRRCQFMDENLNYCLTTSLDPTVIAALTEYAQRAFEAGIDLRSRFVEGYYPIKNDRVGYINAWKSCQLAGIAPKDCQ